jgi:hypothetical protein
MRANRLALAALLAGCPIGGSARAETVLCQAAHATSCAQGSGCEKERTRSALFTIDRAAGKVSDADGNSYTIVPMHSPLPAAESAIVAIGTLAGPTSETLLIGEQSFVASSIALVPPRASLQVGTCAGLAAPEPR